MLSNYIKDKLTEKVKICLEMSGKPSDINIDHIIDKVKDYGMYEIIWDYDLTKPIGIKMLGRMCNCTKINISNGRYYLSFKDPNFDRILLSSQFIEFDIERHRDEILNNLLNNKKKTKNNLVFFYSKPVFRLISKYASGSFII